MILDYGYLIGGTLGIVICNKNIVELLKVKKNSISEFIKNALSVTVSAQIFIMPIMLLNFNQFSTMFWLANLLAAPIIGIATIYGFIVSFISIVSVKIAHIVAIPLEVLLKVLILIADKISSIDFSNILIITPSYFFIIVYYFGIFYFLYKRNKKKHRIEKIIIKTIEKLIIIAFIILTILQIIINIERKITINFIDVGQGDCCLITTENGKKILVDGGGSENYDVGKNILLPYLLDKRIRNIDYAIISHFDSDHCKRNFRDYG